MIRQLFLSAYALMLFAIPIGITHATYDAWNEAPNNSWENSCDNSWNNNCDNSWSEETHTNGECQSDAELGWVNWDKYETACTGDIVVDTCLYVDWDRDASVNVDIPDAGEYEVVGYATRGISWGTQETFVFEVNGTTGNISSDDNGGDQYKSRRNDNMGTFSFHAGNNTINVNRAGNPTNSVSVNRICLNRVSEPEPEIDPPICDLWSFPETVKSGEAVNIGWWTSNADSASIDNGVGVVDLTAGSFATVYPTQTTTYNMDVSGAGGQSSCQITVTVEEPADAPTCTISASPSTITNGESTTISWSTTNADSIQIDNGIGYASTEGYTSVSPTVTTTYTLSAAGEGGNTTCQTTVIVEDAPVVDAPTCNIYIEPDSITNGETSTLFWSTTNADSIQIDNGIGYASATGSISIAPVTTTTYSLTATGAGGSALCQTTIIVDEPPVVEPPVCSIGIDPGTISRGEETTLWWWTADTTTATINNGIGNVTLPSMYSMISPTETTVYTMTASGPGGTTTCQATVVVEDTPIDEPAPECELGVSPGTISNGDTTTLWWWSEGANTATINHGVGSVPLPEADIDVSPTETTVYTMTASGPGGTTTCQATVVVEDTPIDEPDPICELGFSPGTIKKGEGTTLWWWTQDVDGGSINNGMGSVNVPEGYTYIYPTETTTYTMTASGPGGTTTCQATVVVEDTPIDEPDPICELGFSPGTIKKGEGTTLWWWTQDVDGGSINNGMGSVNVPEGYTYIYPTETTTYTMTVNSEKASGELCEATCQATIVVEEAETPPPSCEIGFAPGSVKKGEGTTLWWWSDNATSGNMSGGIGEVSVPEGYKYIYPENNSTFTLEVSGPGGNASCKASVEVRDEWCTREGDC